MKAFRPYVAHLHDLLVKAAGDPNDPTHKTAIDAALDGQPSTELRRHISIKQLRSAGAFFTGSAIARRAVAIGFPRLCHDAVIGDPACGVGDLLVAIVERLPRGPDLDSTLADWSSRIFGRDIEPDFVHATKLRLVLAAMRLLAPSTPCRLPDLDSLFPGIVAGCSLGDKEIYATPSHIIINPPFTLVPAPNNCPWASGKVNAAALFMDNCVARSSPGTHITAVLPDVLRSGSRYGKWRELLGDRFRLTTIEVVGQFDEQTDVDVFIAAGVVRRKIKNEVQTDWVPPEEAQNGRIQDHFDVCVGPVVPYRDPKRGPSYPFIQARDLACWKPVSTIKEHRRFEGRTFTPPFVVVRRTSRPGDTHRAIPTLITGQSPIAVENHLLVLHPKDSTLTTCQQLLTVLRQPYITECLNRRIRCRHLTVSAVGELPWRSR